MFIRPFLTLSIFFFFTNMVAQVCPNIGQNPSTAFPVCGTSTFVQTTVSICGGQKVFSPTCNDNIYEDKNPYYYKFTCFQFGTLFFVITPNTNSDDYDWSLYDITNTNPNNIFTNASLTIASNWSGDGGATGMNNSGTNTFVCGGTGRPRFSKPFNLVQGREYLLMISHFTDSQSGYSLSFGGGSAVITDPKSPKLASVKAACDGKTLTVKLNKKMLCKTIATNGSDFYITPNNATVSAAIGANCNSAFDSDSLTLTLSNTLTAGNYVLRIKKGTDNNTIADYCNNEIPVTDTLSFSYIPGTPTPIDSIVPLQCAANTVTLYFKNKQIKCNSIAADGSDFNITGTYPINIVSAAPINCTNNITSTIQLQLNTTLYNKGTFTISLKNGTDGNTLVDECDIISQVGTAKSFSVKDTVNADFTTVVKLSCVTDTIETFASTANEINQWQWYQNNTLSNQNSSTPQFTYTQFGVKNIKLVVSNGFCSDTTNQNIDLDNFIQADFTAYEDNCPKEPVIFTNTSVGKRLQYNWQFGDGGSSSDTSTKHTYFDLGVDKSYNVTLTITNDLGCTSSITKRVEILKLCGEYVPTAFSPNGDGVNDFFGPLYAVKANQLVFQVYNRWGQKMYETNNWRKPWDGKFRGSLAPTGVYVWQMTYINRDDNKAYKQKGTVVLIR